MRKNRNRIFLTLTLLCVLAACAVKLPEMEEDEPTPQPTQLSAADVGQEEREKYKELAEERAALIAQFSLDLPEGITAGEYDLYYRYVDYGGYPLLDGQGETCGGVAMYMNPIGKFDSDGTLREVSFLQNHASLENFNHVDSDVPCVTAVFSEDVFNGETDECIGTREQWCALWCEQDAKPIYALFIDKEKMDYDAFLELVTSAAFEDGAFRKVE